MTFYFPLNKYEVGGSTFALSCGCLMLASQFHLDTPNYSDLYAGIATLADDPELCGKLGLDPEGLEAMVLVKTEEAAREVATRLRDDGWSEVAVGSVELPDPDPDGKPVAPVVLPERPCCENCEFYQEWADVDDGECYCKCVLSGRLTKGWGLGPDTWCRLYRKARRPEKVKHND